MTPDPAIPQLMSEEQECRDAFENWYSKDGVDAKSVERKADHYSLMQAHISWEAYQAAWQARASSDGMREELGIAHSAIDYYQAVAEKAERDISALKSALVPEHTSSNTPPAGVFQEERTARTISRLVPIVSLFGYIQAIKGHEDNESLNWTEWGRGLTKVAEKADKAWQEFREELLR